MGAIYISIVYIIGYIYVWALYIYIYIYMPKTDKRMHARTKHCLKNNNKFK